MPNTRQCAKYDCEQICFYCDAAVLPQRHEHDHFPEPLMCGGTRVVTACYTCHDLKDRIPFKDWPPGMFFAPLVELGDKLSMGCRDAHVLLELFGDAEARWDLMTREGRLFYAKLRAHVERDKFLYPSTLF
jgi:hypothetical protein